MHPNPSFRQQGEARNLAFARDRSFGTLSVNGPEGPLFAHVPFVLAEDGKSAQLHLVRSGPIARIGAAPAVIVVNGPDGYVSPDWYGVPDQVPTWNYVAVHLRGQLAPLPAGSLRDLLDRQSAAFEDRLAPKPPWTTAKMTPEVLDKMLRQILPFRLDIEEVTGTWKLNQNKPEAVREGAARQIGPGGESGIGQELEALAALMASPPTD